MNILSGADVLGTLHPQNQAGIEKPDWYKDAVIYQLHVKAFADSNNDGIGDFVGLQKKLDYLQDLGVNTLWLLPFFKSPLRDDGYDIADYRTINPAYGTMGEFRKFMAEAKRRNLRVIIELVINHTSDQHPWFQRARRARPGSHYRDWYVWSDDPNRYSETRIIFTDTEKSNWTWDSVAGQFYWHRFFSHQPDLNFDNPQVVAAIVKIMQFWIDRGVDGFRLDAIPYLVERDGSNNENLPETHAVIKKLRAELDAYAPGRLFLAEANQWPEDVSAYYGDGDECHMAYHFPLMPRIFMGIAQEDRHPITDIMRQTPDIPSNCQWALFLRNHDELTLEMVTDIERDYLWSTYASDARARINLGIRRRLAPLMEGDRRKIELMNSILFSFPGTPILYYGDEIGMGDNVFLSDRDGVRTPMQWTPDRNAGFSQCNPAQLYLPAIMDQIYGYQAVNVEAQSRSMFSLLNWMKRLIAVHRSTECFGRGSLTFLRPENRSILSYLRQDGDEIILCVANLSRAAQAAEIDLSVHAGRMPLEMLGRTWFPTITAAPFQVTLPPYGFFWFQLCREKPLSYKELPMRPDYPTLVWLSSWNSLNGGGTRQTFESEALPGFLRTQRWFADKSARLLRTKLKTLIPLRDDDVGVALAIIDSTSSGYDGRYVLPLVTQWGRADLATQGQIPGMAEQVLAAIRRGARDGVMRQAAGDVEFVRLMLEHLHAADNLAHDGATIRFIPTEKFTGAALPPIETARSVGVEQTNSSIIVNDQFVLKVYRQLQPGLNPDLEIGRHLTKRGYRNTPEFLGGAEIDIDGKESALAVLHRFVLNQGDAWALSAGYLDRILEECRLLGADCSLPQEAHATYLERMTEIGARLAELHGALADDDDEAFTLEPMQDADIAAERSELLEKAAALFADLQRSPSLPERARPMVEAILARKDEIVSRLVESVPSKALPYKMRYHGDFHLGQVMIVQGDVFILDFEGEPRRKMEDRRRKGVALRDVAGLLRSLDYAGLSAIQRLTLTLPDGSNSVSHAVEEWRHLAEEAFLNAYRAGMQDHPAWPGEETANRWLTFLQLDKVFYEVGYELANRPSWLHVPLIGLWALLFRDEALPS